MKRKLVREDKPEPIESKYRKGINGLATNLFGYVNVLQMIPQQMVVIYRFSASHTVPVPIWEFGSGSSSRSCGFAIQLNFSQFCRRFNQTVVLIIFFVFFNGHSNALSRVGSLLVEFPNVFVESQHGLQLGRTVAAVELPHVLPKDVCVQVAQSSAGHCLKGAERTAWFLK